jgi:hypothetical protein
MRAVAVRAMTGEKARLWVKWRWNSRVKSGSCWEERRTSASGSRAAAAPTREVACRDWFLGATLRAVAIPRAAWVTGSIGVAGGDWGRTGVVSKDGREDGFFYQAFDLIHCDKAIFSLSMRAEFSAMRGMPASPACL